MSNTPQKNAIRICATLFAIGFFGLILGFLLSNDGVQMFLVGVACLSLMFVTIPIALSKRYFVFEPISFVIISVIFGMFLKTFYIIYGSSIDSRSSSFLLGGLQLHEIQYGAVVILTGLLTFSLGYILCSRGMGVPDFLINYKLSRSKVFFVGVVLVFLSIVFFVLLIQSVGFVFNDFSDLSKKRFLESSAAPSDRFSSVSYLYYRIALVSKASMYIFFFIAIKYDRRWISASTILFLIALFINIAVPFFVSNKAGIVLPVLDLIIISYIVRKEFNVKYISFVLFLTILLLGVAVSLRGGDSVASLSVLDKIFGNRYFIELTKTSHIVNAVPGTIDYFNGRSFIGWMNFILPADYEINNKYFADLGFYLGYMVFGNANSGVTPGILAELYLNFGFIGVLVGMFILGYAMKFIHNGLFRYANYSFAVLIIYTVIIVRMPVFLFNSSFGVTFLKISVDLAIILLFLMLTKAKIKR